MSLKAIAWAMEVTCPSPTAKLVLLTLADAHNGHTGDCYPSLARIVKSTGLSDSGVKAAIRSLEGNGLVNREVEFDPTGRTRGVRYHLACDNIGRGRHETPPHAQSVNIEQGGGAEKPLGGGARKPPEGACGDPSNIEPEIEPENRTGKKSAEADQPAPKVRKTAKVIQRPEYPGEFEMLWAEFPKNPAASKLEGFRAWEKLSDEDRDLCLEGAIAYAAWLGAQQRPPTVCHLATFVHQRRFDGFSEQEAAQ